jgi:hypothetical protein
MPGFRRVEADQAGPGALGILVPPGRRTLAILRPRALDWDLLVVRPNGSRPRAPALWEMDRHQAGAIVEELERALEQAAALKRAALELVPAPEQAGFRIQAQVGPFRLIACRRVPGEPYRPMVFECENEARRQAERIAQVLSPPPGVEQEFYRNTRHFR